MIRRGEVGEVWKLKEGKLGEMSRAEVGEVMRNEGRGNDRKVRGNEGGVDEVRGNYKI